MLTEKNSEVLTEIRIPARNGGETFISALTSQTLCTPWPWWRRPAMWWRQEVRSTCHPLAQSIFLKLHWRLTRQDHKEKYVCLSVSDLWCSLCTCLCGCTHVCVGQRTTVSIVSIVLFSDRISYWVHRCSYECQPMSFRNLLVSSHLVVRSQTHTTIHVFLVGAGHPNVDPKKGFSKYWILLNMSV